MNRIKIKIHTDMMRLQRRLTTTTTTTTAYRYLMTIKTSSGLIRSCPHNNNSISNNKRRSCSRQSITISSNSSHSSNSSNSSNSNINVSLPLPLYNMSCSCHQNIQIIMNPHHKSYSNNPNSFINTTFRSFITCTINTCSDSNHSSHKKYFHTTTTTTKHNNNHHHHGKSPFATVQEKPSTMKKKPKGKIPINKTPRGKIAMKMAIGSENNNESNYYDDKNDDNMNDTNHNESLEQQQQQPPPPLPPQMQHYDHTHFVRGGTHCDPPPPPFTLSNYGDSSLYTLILLRHGESEWNSQNRYTGWCDVNLTPKGKEEAKQAGLLLKNNDIELDHVFTSVLKRAIMTTNIALHYANQSWVPITKSWRLNERHYGSLQGYNKDTAYEELDIDQELVMEMRRSYRTKPPRMEDDHKFWHGSDRRYKSLSVEQLDKTRNESLQW
jgi:hypothetical protein